VNRIVSTMSMLLPALVGVAISAQQQSGTFRTGVDVVSLNVTVTDAANHYVTDLDRPDFAVFEDGAKQELTFFNRRRQPIALSLLLDSSASMETTMPTLKIAAMNFVQRLSSDDLAQVIDFDSRVEITQAFTSSKPALVVCTQLDGTRRWTSTRGTDCSREAGERVGRERRSDGARGV